MKDLGLHKWRSLKHGLSIGMRLDARECLRCGRFEVWVYGGYRRANRENFPGTEPA